MTDVEVKAALSALEAVALTLYGEASREPVEGIVGVAHVIRNRQKKSGQSWQAVVHQRLQFSCWWPQGGVANYERVMATARKVLSGEAITRAAWHECVWVAEGVMAGRVRDNVKGARHYLTTALLQTAPPAWAKGRQPTVVIGAHAFIAGVP